MEDTPAPALVWLAVLSVIWRDCETKVLTHEHTISRECELVRSQTNVASGSDKQPYLDVTLLKNQDVAVCHCESQKITLLFFEFPLSGPLRLGWIVDKVGVGAEEKDNR